MYSEGLVQYQGPGRPHANSESNEILADWLREYFNLKTVQNLAVSIHI